MEYKTSKTRIRQIWWVALMAFVFILALIIRHEGRSFSCDDVFGGAVTVDGASVTSVEALMEFPRCFSGRRVALYAILRPLEIDGTLWLYGNRDFALSESHTNFIGTNLHASDLAPSVARYLSDGYAVVWIEGRYVYSGNQERPESVDARMLDPVDYIRIEERFGDEDKIPNYSDVAYLKK